MELKEAATRMSVAMDCDLINCWDASLALAILYDISKEKALDTIVGIRKSGMCLRKRELSELNDLMQYKA